MRPWFVNPSGQGHLSTPLVNTTGCHLQGQVEGGFMGRTNKLVDGCYSFWQGGAFPLLAELLAQQRAQQDAAGSGSAAEGRGGAGDAVARLTAAQRLCALLLDEGNTGEGSDGEGGDGGEGSAPAGGAQAAPGGAGGAGAAPDGQTLKEWVNSLPHLSPRAAAERHAGLLQQQLDAAVEASLEAEEAYVAAKGGPAGGPLQQEAVAALQRAADLQQVCMVPPSCSQLLHCDRARLSAQPACGQRAKVAGQQKCSSSWPWLLDMLAHRAGTSSAGTPTTTVFADVPSSLHASQALESCQQHSEALACGAATLLDAAGPRLEAAAAAAGGGAPEGGRLPQLYDAAALQLWLLKACQTVSQAVAWTRRLC